MADSSTVPVDRIRIFDREGFPLAEFRASIPRSFLIGDEGRAAFTYPSRKTQIVNKDVLRFGNWLLIENSLLPPWVGVVDVPREWDARRVTVTAYTPERVFSWRRGPLEERLTASPGAIFEKLLQYVNSAEATIIRLGNIYRGGLQMEETINPTKLNEDLKRIWERSGEEYQWRPVVGADGKLTVLADWQSRIGADTGILLQEGKHGGNIEATGNIMVEDGPIVNDLLAVGDGESWTSRPTQTIVDTTSRGEYGLRQDSKEYSGVTNLQTLADNGAKEIAAFAQPANAFQINALNIGNTFSYIRLGNRFALQLENIGFYGGGVGYSTTVRVLAMSYSPDTKNKIQLVVEND
jgi:hypothetical protein